MTTLGLTSNTAIYCIDKQPYHIIPDGAPVLIKHRQHNR